METTKNMIYSQLTMFMRERERENKKKAFTTSVVTVVQLLSPVWLFATLWTAAHHVPLSYTFSQSVFTLMFTESVVPSDHLKHSCHFSFCLQCLPAWESFSMSWLFASGGQSIGVSASAAVLQRNIQGWLPLGLFDLLAVQGTLKSLLQHHNSKASVLPHSDFFVVQLSHQYMTTGKTIVLTIQNLVSKIMSLLFNMLSRFVVVFLPWCNGLLISWLQKKDHIRNC